MPVQIATLHEKAAIIPGGERTHLVMLWPGYGVVCPSLVTSNGSAQMVAEAIRGRLDLQGCPDIPDFTATLCIDGHQLDSSVTVAFIRETLLKTAEAHAKAVVVP